MPSAFGLDSFVSELNQFIFEGLPVRGALVRLTDSWQEILRRRSSNPFSTPYPIAVQNMLGQMTAAAVLMQVNIKFNGALILQIFGDGPVKLAVAEVQADLSLRATATMLGEVDRDASLAQMVNQNGQGRCAITLDPKDRLSGQQPYQGVVPLLDQGGGQHLGPMLQHYMRQSEQLETCLVLAANDTMAAGLLIQRLPLQGAGNIALDYSSQDEELAEHYLRIATLASSLKSEELLTLDAETVLRRLFWEEKIVRFTPDASQQAPRFACSCSRERVGKMILGLGLQEAQEILAERGEIEVACEFCGLQYRFDSVDTAYIFKAGPSQPASKVTQ